MAENNKPTSGMKSAAKRALAWKEQGHAGGTAVGLNRAHQIVNGENLSDSTVKRMFSFFSRHEVDKKATGFSAGEEGYPSPGRVAWDLWGGDAGFSWSRKKVNSMKKELAEQFVVDEIKKSFEEGILNKIGGSSSVNETPYNASHAEYYERSSTYIDERIQEGGNDMSTTEPDPTGDIAVTKAADSTLVRSELEKAIAALTNIMKGLPDAGRADSVSVSNETAPMQKAEPDASRATDVTVANETAPGMNKDMTSADGGAPNQGTTEHVAGDGEYSVQANAPVASTAEPMTKASGTCSECGDACGEDETKCSKCMKMEKADSAEDGDDKEPDDDEDDKMEKADTCPDCGKADCTCKVYKSAQDLINEAKITKSVWGGAFGAPSIPRVK